MCELNVIHDLNIATDLLNIFSQNTKDNKAKIK